VPENFAGLDTNNMKDTWRITRNLTNTNSNIPPLTVNGKTATTIQEKRNAFADILEQIFTTNSDVDRTFIVSMEGFLETPLTELGRTRNYSEIASVARHLKPRRAIGPDGIQNIILQHLLRLVLKFIAKIFNGSHALNYFPTQWNEAKIIMLQKPGKYHTSPLNYTPISLLNSPGKLFEKIILKRLNFQLQELKVIRNDQYGSKRGHSTTHRLLRNIERIMHGLTTTKL
jgi:hypothetical protein